MSDVILIVNWMRETSQIGFILNVITEKYYKKKLFKSLFRLFYNISQYLYFEMFQNLLKRIFYKCVEFVKQNPKK